MDEGGVTSGCDVYKQRSERNTYYRYPMHGVGIPCMVSVSHVCMRPYHITQMAPHQSKGPAHQWYAHAPASVRGRPSVHPPHACDD